MKKFILTIILLFVGIRYGLNYLLSEEFQKYGDREKAQWTCHVNNVLGGFYVIGSSYRSAYNLYDRVLTRCPETPMAEEALFRKASCLEELSDPQGAMAAYEEYIKTYPAGDKAINAQKALNRVRLSK